MSDLAANWNKEEHSSGFESAGARLKGSLQGQKPLKPRLESAQQQIRVQIAKLTAKSDRLSQSDTVTFGKVVSLIQKNDVQRAKIHANELTEIRKMQKMVVQAKLAFEQVELRINTISDLGDMTSSLSSALGVIRGIGPGLNNVLPDAQNEMQEISTLISGIMADTGQSDTGTPNIEIANEEAEGIIAEAGAVAEQSILDKFPDIPPSLRQATSPTYEFI